MATADAVIIGGGVMGCGMLYNLATRGVTNTVLLEKDVLASGSTSKSQAILRMHYSNEVTTDLAWKSLELFKNFEDMTGIPSGYTKTGYFMIVDQDDRAALEENVALHKRVGVDTDIVTVEDVRDIAPMLSTSDNEAYAYEPQSGYADPYSVTTGYANAARELGAQVRSGTQVTGIDIEGDRVRAVLTADERIETDTAVIAAGPWSGSLMKSVGVDLHLQPVRHQVVMLRRPQDVVPDHPIVGDVVYDLSARPDTGNLTLVGVGEEDHADPDTYNQGVDMPMVEKTFDALVNRMPGMSQALFRGGWSGLFTTTPDWHPVLDKVDGIEGLYCAVGFSGHGFKLAPMITQVMAEMITGEQTSVDISMLDLKRFEEGRLMKSRYSMQVLA
ncbi:MAG: FAD-binding oxidoreductase [SAR202 cluster bacterium]|jgi:glycine/D-amino acid oxidase-like deaminating enzyme|nr:FAD-binding oxidoreductase [SAR202 cluster bacterium]